MKGRLHIPLLALPLRFWFRPSSLQFAGLQNGVWHCRNPQASFLASLYETKKDREKRCYYLPQQPKHQSLSSTPLLLFTQLPEHPMLCPHMDTCWMLHTGCPERWPWEELVTTTVLEGAPHEGCRPSQGKQRDPTNNRPHRWMTLMFPEP